MSKLPLLYVANWKMKLSFNKTLDFCKQNKKEFEQLANGESANIVLCPSFDSIFFVVNYFKDSDILIGGQACSSHDVGAYTGQVSAQSLSEVGCTYCIVGHSERRMMLSETDEDVASKVIQVIKNNMTPVICVGESRREYEEKKIYDVLVRQVTSACQAVKNVKQNCKFCIAYEPIWAIGTGDTPTNDYIDDALKNIASIVKSIIPNITLILLYGGSVHDKNIEGLKKLSSVNGFLIGGASLDFQKFQKIVT